MANFMKSCSFSCIARLTRRLEEQAFGKTTVYGTNGLPIIFCPKTAQSGELFITIAKTSSEKKSAKPFIRILSKVRCSHFISVQLKVVILEFFPSVACSPAAVPVSRFPYIVVSYEGNFL